MLSRLGVVQIFFSPLVTAKVCLFVGEIYMRKSVRRTQITISAFFIHTSKEVPLSIEEFKIACYRCLYLLFLYEATFGFDSQVLLGLLKK